MATGEQKATAISKEYKTTDELYGDTGAIDEITLILSEKLNIAISSIQKQVLKMVKKEQKQLKNILSLNLLTKVLKRE